jgi:hypothetical protein
MAMVFCRGCGKQLHDTAPACPGCGAPQVAVTAAAPEARKSGATAPASAQAISANWRKKFLLIKKAGGPKLSKAKDLKLGERMSVVFNIWGFLLGPFYYLAKGMWKKSIVLCALALIIIVILDTLLPAMRATDIATSCIAPVIFGTRANVDYYKKMVLGESGWW